MSEMPDFKIGGDFKEDEKKVGLWEYAKVVLREAGGNLPRNGDHFMVFAQVTGSCLPAHAPVRMADGSEKPIAEIRVGDKVISHTGAARMVQGVQKKRTDEQMRRIRVRGWADRLFCTDNHLLPVWAGEISWRPAQDILPGDFLLIGYGTSEPKPQISVVSNEAIGIPEDEVYDIEVEHDHTFLAWGFVVHNCVGNGLGQAIWYLSAVEVVRLKDPEEVLLPFYLLPYGRSRMYAGMRGRGEGSLGSTGAKAVKIDGVVHAGEPGLPAFKVEGGLTWGRDAEYQWSDGAAISEEWLTRSRKHLVQTTAQCRTADDVRQAIVNRYPCTIASNWGGLMQCPVTGNPPVLLNRRSGSWAHQMSVIGWQEHPELGELFYVLNSWGPKSHGAPPDDAPPGGFWIKKEDMQRIASEGETFAFSQFQGFPSNRVPLDWTH